MMRAEQKRGELLAASDLARWVFAIVAVAVLCAAAPANAQSRLAEFAADVRPQEFFSKATRFGTPQGEPPVLPVYAEETQLGIVYLNSDFTGSVGYSGKPVHIL